MGTYTGYGAGYGRAGRAAGGGHILPELRGAETEPDNIAEVLDWSGQPYGSAWVHRQAHQFLLEDFAHIATNPGQLERIGKETLRSVLCSDYLQCSEAELVAATVRWGELRCCTVLCVS